MMLYPGVTTPGAVSQTPIQIIDVFPTLAEIASGKAYTNKQIQGKSLLPEIKGTKKLPNRYLYFYRSYEDQYAAVMHGDWKLIKYRSGSYKLFNVVKDISEQNDLINTGLAIENQLKKRLATWEKKAVPVY